MFYLCTGEIGLWGLIYYVGAQTLGGVFSGLTVGALTLGLPGSLTRLPIPLPLTTNSSFVTVVLLEMFGAALVAWVLGTMEFINSPGVSNTEPKSDTTTAQLLDNFRKAVVATTVAIFILVFIGYQFQVFAYGNTAYQGGLFSGMLAGGADLKTFGRMSNLADSDYAGSVWTTRGHAAVFYFLMPWASGILAAIGFVIAVFVGIQRLTYEDNSAYRKQEMQFSFNKGVNASVQQPLLSPSPSAPFKGPAPGSRNN